MKFNSELSIEELREAFTYNPKTGELRWNYRPECGRLWNYKHAGNIAGSPIQSSGYIGMTIRGRFYVGHRIAWALHFGEWPTYHLDHKNRKRADNRIENLRLATRTQNAANRYYISKSGLRGVRLTRNGTWQVRIQDRPGNRITIGTFATKEEATEAYRIAAVTAFGEFIAL
jgi:HNH endonuclease